MRLPQSVAFILLMSALAAHGSEAQMTADSNKRLVQRLYEECISAGKLDLLPQFIAATYVGAGGEKGPSAFAGPVAALRQGFPDIEFTIEDMVAEGDRVAVRWRWKGTHKGTFGGFPPSRKQLTNEGMAIYQIKAEKILQAWQITDRLGFLHDIGAVPKEVGSRRRPRE
jgi:steroid delta-isomerase-like uncharacterized protein